MKMTAQKRGNWPRTISLAVLAVYWVALFTATHIPQPRLPVQTSDKTLHVAAFGGLAFLLALWWSLRGPFGWRQLSAALAILAVYGAFDEATQPLTGRVADWRDWLADLSGALAGLALLAALRAVWRRRA